MCETLIWLVPWGTNSRVQNELCWDDDLDKNLIWTVFTFNWKESAGKGDTPLSGRLTFFTIFNLFVRRAIKWKTNGINVASRLRLRFKLTPAYISFNITWTVGDKEGCSVMEAKWLDNSSIYRVMLWTLKQIPLHDISQTPTAGLELSNIFIITYLQSRRFLSFFFLLKAILVCCLCESSSNILCHSGKKDSKFPASPSKTVKPFNIKLSFYLMPHLYFLISYNTHMYLFFVVRHGLASCSK